MNQIQDDPESSNYFIDEGMLYKKPDNILIIPHDHQLIEKILYELHDCQLSAHQGIGKTLNNIKQIYCWKNMNDDIISYIKSCPICQQDKPNNQKISGLLQPIQSPSIRWHTITIDFIVQLPMTKLKHDAILVVVDKFTKMSHFIPTTTKVTAPETAKLIFDNIIRLHGLPSVIISDRDSRFTSNFWKSLFELLNTKLSMSTAFHPQSNGQTEIMNRYLEQALRHYTDIIQNDWDTYLTHIEIAHNNSVNTTTKYTPFI